MRVGSGESCEQQGTESGVSQVRDSGLFKCGQDAGKGVGSRAVDTLRPRGGGKGWEMREYNSLVRRLVSPHSIVGV